MEGKLAELKVRLAEIEDLYSAGAVLGCTATRSS